MLAKHGVAERVDLRSYEKMIAAGDAPEGLAPQPKRGPASTGRSRRLARETGEDISAGGMRQKEIQETNEDLWENWLLLRHLRREQARNDGTSERIAATREAKRRQRADAEREAIQTASTTEEAEAAWRRPSLSIWGSGVDTWHAASVAAQQERPAAAEPNDEFDREIDPETYENPDTKEAPRFKMRNVRGDQQRVRTRGES